MIYTGYVKVAPGKPQTGQAKSKFSPRTKEANFNFSLGEGKKSTGSGWVGSGFTGPVTDGCAGELFKGSGRVYFATKLSAGSFL